VTPLFGSHKLLHMFIFDKAPREAVELLEERGGKRVAAGVFWTLILAAVAAALGVIGKVVIEAVKVIGPLLSGLPSMFSGSQFGQTAISVGISALLIAVAAVLLIRAFQVGRDRVIEYSGTFINRHVVQIAHLEANSADRTSVFEGFDWIAKRVSALEDGAGSRPRDGESLDAWAISQALNRDAPYIRAVGPAPHQAEMAVGENGGSGHAQGAGVSCLRY
jgi:hypothetical protein